ncbi:leucine-rich repeat-containing protein 56 [Plakobranchus ocellatus]|uniref:Leucine-rich repeat-containing protein 56 n=1 Tax=Plakobranchus ocellatus TaxID=259542 RepID=A0AAV4C779_9GAST|nr:leucine-rich repeat-containing protein 56 [Plakobranchus ocellatus]
MALAIKGLPFNGHRGHTKENKALGNMEDVGKYLEESSHRSHSRLSDGPSRPVSALARGVQITEFAESRVNPTPLLLEESDILLEQYLSPGKLQLLTGVDNLSTVECLELKVDSRETSLGNFGSLLPNLRELKLSGSCISCVRDLGSSLRNLRILWLTRCGLEELDGISSMLNLVELYLEYNEISDLSPLSMLEQLEILDLEGNNIDDITQVQFLSLCPRLRRLALDGNPVCVFPSPTQDEPDDNYDYRGTIRSILPNLLVLDDERIDIDLISGKSTAPSAESCSRHHNVFDEDWAYLEELQQDAFLKQDFTHPADDQAQTVTEGDRPPTGALRPATSYRPGSALRPSSGFRPLSASRRRPSTMSPGTPGNHQGGAASTRAVSTSEGIESSSELTMGAVICGNPSKALHQRRQGGPGSKEEIKKGLSRLMQKGAVFSHSEGAEDEPMKAQSEMNSIIEELQSWKVDHDRRMKEILKTKEAQILVVDHDEAEDVASSDEDEADDLIRSASHISALSSFQQCHAVDLRLKRKPAATSEEKENSHRQKIPAALMKASSTKHQFSSNQSAYHHQPSSNNDNLNDSWSDDNSSDEKDAVKNRLAQSKHGKQVLHASERGGSPSVSSQPGSFQHQLSSSSHSQNGDQPVVSPDSAFVLSHLSASEHQRRSSSRGSSAGELGPLRAPSPTSAQIINSMRSRQQAQSPPTSPRPRKLRVGPTGLPLSSQSQQPVIRGSIGGQASSRGISGVGAGLGTPSSRPGVALLPSQPRIARQLPEPPSHVPRPPKQS